MRKPFILGLIQMSCNRSATENLQHASVMLRTAAKQGAQVAILPELFLGPYFCQTEEHRFYEWSEPVPGPTTETLSKIARETGMSIVGSLFERRMSGIYHNTAMVLDADGTYLGKYRKMHIPDDPLYLEKFYFTPGDLGFKSFNTRHANIGTLVCWDQWYPEAARLTALQGADILVYPTAIGWHPSEKAEFGEAQQGAWEGIQRGHAIANGCYVAAVNRVGHEGPINGGIEFWGGSFVYDPFGRLLHRASNDKEEVILVKCDPAIAETTRQHWPFLRDRRIDAYGGITQRAHEGDEK
ncbi:MAG: carbon-nitrogen hydrolase [Planctomycetia bacterium]|nr:carbon-nitrogen hydrolase [Planctomycetia bacterium]